MAVTDFLRSKRVRQLSALSMIVRAGSELRKGNVRGAALYLAGAGVSYKNSAAGFVVQIALRLLGRKGGNTSA